MKRLILSLVAVAMMAIGTPAWSDWDPGQPAKWFQLPDLSITGIDVNATADPTGGGLYILADDFQCTETGPITDVHIWGSWLNDFYGVDPSEVAFTLSIHADIPKDQSPTGYSMPGDVLWVKDFNPGEFVVRPYESGILEGWLDPPDLYVFPADTVCWQYNFRIDPADAFVQQGTPDQPVVYWLDVQARPIEPQARFGWKTSLDHWNDDAVWGQGSEPYPGPWSELRYPPNHELYPQSIDLAFVITGEGGGPGDLEYGDAPEGALAYPALGVNGAFPTCMNVLIAGFVQHNNFGGYLGPMVDFEADGNAGLCPTFTPNQYDQDECFNDGDAGLIIPEPFTIVGPIGGENVVPCPQSAGTPLGYTCQQAVWGGNIDVNVTNFMPPGAIGYVNVLIDWNQDGAWGGSSTCAGIPPVVVPEHVLVNFPVPNGYSGPLSALGPGPFTIGPSAGYVWMRISITEIQVQTDWDGSGSFEDGESEDYLIFVDTPPVDRDFGDAPDFVGAPAYPTLLPSGARHIIAPNVFLGAQIDAEPDGLPDPNALGDDNNNLDDEDGVVFTSPLIPGSNATVDVTASVAGFLWAWIDFDGNTSWAEATDQIFAGQPVAAGLNTLSYFVPATAVPGTVTYARFRYVTANLAALSYTGEAQDGEVEDYEVVIEEPPVESKWSQFPHPPQEGFDAASDFWWNEGSVVKWEQLPNAQFSGVHAHDYDDGTGIVQAITVADDWLCEGGVVTDFHWWGAVENPGAGILGFNLSIHANDPACLPLDPPLWKAFVPIGAITVTPTGVFNSVGLQIIRYDYDLPQADWFYQEQGIRYWFDLSAVSIDPLNPYKWVWQEHNRSAIPILCGAASRQDPAMPFWQTIVWADNRLSDMAFRVTSKDLQEVNKVVADDFISDGRKIDAVRWWGSYLDPTFRPEDPVEPYVIDGWFISFHHTDPVANPSCPPDLAAGDPHPTVLGIYYAPANAVQIYNLGYPDCLGHDVYEYKIDLSRCCLLCSEVDPRNNEVPAQPEGFLETCDFGYWLDIQAVVGVTWDPAVGCTYADRILTGHRPSDQTADRHFWGWHTSPDARLQDACTGMILDMTPYPPQCWDYGNWVKQPWLCTTPEQPVNMSFELLTGEYPPVRFVKIASMGRHNTVPPVDLALQVDPTDGASTHEGRVVSQPWGDLYIDVTFDRAISAASLVVNPAIAGAVATANGTNVVTITYPGALPADETCYKFDLAGTVAADGTVFGTTGCDTDFCLCYNLGDVDGDGVVLTSDKNKVLGAAQWGQAISAIYNPPTVPAATDVDRDGTVLTGDKNTVLGASNWGHSPTPCP